MTDRQVWAEIKQWQKRLQLADWRFGWERIDAEEIAPGTAADIRTKLKYRTAALRVATTLPDDSIRRSIRHEMLHLVLVDVGPIFEAALERLSPDMRALLYELWSEKEEQTVSRLERAFEAVEPLDKPGEVSFQDPRV